MDDRWAFPIPMTMQRQAGSAPKSRNVESPPVVPSDAGEAAVKAGGDAAESEIRNAR